MSTQYTPGRIYFRANNEANSYSLIDRDANKWVIAVQLNGEHTTAQQAEILERMAACWNTCKDVSTEALEKTQFSGHVNISGIGFLTSPDGNLCGLKGNEYKELRMISIRTNAVLHQAQQPGGWTQDTLTMAITDLQAAIEEDGNLVEAYLGDVFLGSSQL